MARTPQYEKLLAELDAGELNELERKVLEVLLKAPSGMTRRGLVRAIYGVEAQQNLSNDPHDRKIRKAIESLRDRMIPIVSSSGKAGYRLDTSPEAIQNMIAELKSRIAHMEQKIEAIQQHYDIQGEWLGGNTA
jgi:DNA-binding IscR family transcriptional regulator